MNMKHSQQGFTLMELIITTAILAITLAIAVPAFTGVVGSSKLNGQASELQAAMTYARTEAVRLNRSVLFCHSSDGSTCSSPADDLWQGWLVRAAGATLENPVGPVLRAGVVAGAPFQVTSGDAMADAGHAIRFNPQGLARTFGNNAPLSDSLRVCTKQAATSPNIRNIQFNSGGRSQIVFADDAGLCS